jgi:hypothetical protein
MAKTKQVIKVNGQAGKPSGRQLRKWRIQSRCGEDKSQLLFSATSGQEVELKANPSKFATITQKGIDPYLNVRCPFCLSHLPLTKFLITLLDKKGRSKGFDRGRGKCPQCGQGMQLRTLTSMRKWMLARTPEEGVKQYAAWVYAYRSSGFFQKINFANFNSMLKSMDWSRDFWDEYKRLKGDLPSEEQRAADDEAGRLYDEVFS